MERQYKKIGIVFKKNDDGGYSYDGAHNFSLDEEKGILEESNIVSLDIDDLKKIGENKDFNIVGDIRDERDSLIFLVNEEAYNYFYEKSEDNNLSEEEFMDEILNQLNDSFVNVKNISTEKIKDMVSYNVQFFEKKKELEMNASSTNFVSSKKKEKIIIDMSKVNPEKIIENIKSKVIAQDETVATIVNNIYNNQLILDSNNDDLINSSKSNILLDGPTGTGKTLIIKEVAKELSIPMINKSTTSFSASGYKGADLSEMLVSLLKEANGDIEAAQRGIIILDEFDKLGGKSAGELEMKKAVQQELLTYLSGATFPVQYNGKTYDFDTSHVTFICLGAFTDLREKKISEELSKDGKYSMKPEDYIKDGLMREIVGRFSLITATQSLGKEDLVKILKESKISPLIQLKEMCKQIYNKELIYDDAMIEKIANEALEENTGARALQTVVNGMRNVILSELRDNKLDKIELNDEILLKSKEIYERSVKK